MRLPLLLTSAVLFLATSLAPAAYAQTDLSLSPDITIDLDGTIVADEAVGFAPNPGTTSLTNLGPLPESADVVAFHRQSPTEVLFALDTTVQLGGNVYVPGDVISWNGSTHGLAFDSGAAGLPAGLIADAVGRDVLGNILLSFDHVANLGAGVIAADEDVVRFVGLTPSIAFDGSATGLADGLDVDGLHDLGVGRFALSFDTGGMIGGVAFADEDLLYVDATAGTWYLLVDGSELDADLGAADVDAFAVPEPGLGASLVCGGMLLGLMGTRRRQPSHALRDRARDVGLRSSRGWYWLAPFAVMLVASAAWASDGALEINQTCAVETGCFAGDTAGFPVTISQPGSYRLSGNLALASDVNGIQISSSYVTVDLNGFEIAGTTTCTGSGSAISCGSGAGAGIYGQPSPTAITLRNGVVRNHGFIGVALEGNAHRIENVTARHNGSYGMTADFRTVCSRCTTLENGIDGMRLNQGAIVESSIAMGNGDEGIELTGNGGVVSGSTASENGGNGIQITGETGTVYGSSSRENAGSGFLLTALSKFGKDNVSGANGSPDSCGGGICTDRNRFYVTRDVYTGADPFTPGVCIDGFHFGSLDELQRVEKYDWRLGWVGADSGFGAPSVLGGGWARSGNEDVDNGGAYSNCSVWTSQSASNDGTATMPSGGLDLLWRWFMTDHACNIERRIWCVED